ncbi:phosphoheptose isomerase [candidate division GN15 bacterium]|nr:phosphoheptose isomerase [candidate division GN15 bacterium]
MTQGLLQISAGNLNDAFTRMVRRGVRDNVVPRIMTRDASVFGKDRKLKKLITNRLGWVDSTTRMRRQVANIERFGKEVFRTRTEHVVLMGMGGSSLCPELFGLMHRKHPKLKSFDVIDSTDPAAVSRIARKIDPKRTLFIVSSKSGGTVETRSQEAFFWQLCLDAKVRQPGSRFVAITDKGSALQKLGRKKKYRKIFLNPSDIGGRYSALSYFGLVPAFFAGVDLRALLDDAYQMQKVLTSRDDNTNPALLLGALMATCAKAGLDKMTCIAGKRVAPLVPWIEQLVAESTGKRKKGVVPIEAEPLGRIQDYGKDRFFVFFKMAGEKTPLEDRLRRVLQKKRIPVVHITLGSKAELGRQFLLWEAATAVCGHFLKINPFDEPNVTESKEITKSILAQFEKLGEFPQKAPKATWGKLTLIAHDEAKRYRAADKKSLSAMLKRFFGGVRPPMYFATMGYFKSDTRTEEAFAKLRQKLQKQRKLATLRGYGPRYLHSIGQLYKGGPPDGVFVVFMRTRYGTAKVPGQAYSFGDLITAQALGDAQALVRRHLPTLVIAIDGNPAEAIRAFSNALGRALRK